MPKVLTIKHGTEVKALFGRRIRARVPLNKPTRPHKQFQARVCRSTHLWEMEPDSLIYRRLK